MNPAEQPSARLPAQFPALVAIVLVVVVLLSGCAGDDKLGVIPTFVPSQSPASTLTPAPAPTSAVTQPATVAGPTPTPLADESDFREFAHQVDAQLRAANPRFLVERANYERHECSAEDLTPTVGQYPCNEAGEVVEYIGLGTDSEGVLLQPAQFALWTTTLLDSLPQATDEFGSGELRVYAYCIDESLGRHWTLATHIHPRDDSFEAPYRRVLTIDWDYIGEEWRTVGTGVRVSPRGVFSVTEMMTLPARFDSCEYLRQRGG